MHALKMDNPLPSFNRIITTNNEKGLAVVDHQIEEESLFDNGIEGGKVGFCLAYTTTGFPVDLNDDLDLKNYQDKLDKKPGLVQKTGSVLRIVVSDTLY